MFTRKRNVSNFAQFVPRQGHSLLAQELHPLPGKADERLASLSLVRICPGHLTNLREIKMYLTGEGLIIILLVGLIAGWLAGQIVQGTGFGIVGDLVIGIIGAFIGGWLLPQLGLHLGSGIISAIINATIGAVILLLIIRLIRGGGGWRRSWGGNWGRRW
jgi:uncharacterized membrane protein YeaQ/YmgE (transglycosylase-associated protein family)